MQSLNEKLPLFSVTSDEMMIFLTNQISTIGLRHNAVCFNVVCCSEGCIGCSARYGIAGLEEERELAPINGAASPARS